MSALHYDRDGNGHAPRCGTPGRTQVTSDRADVTCLTCLNLMAGVHGVGVRPFDLKPCGTVAAYRRHKRRGERVCESCAQARDRDAADRKARRRSRQEVLAA